MGVVCYLAPSSDLLTDEKDQQPLVTAASLLREGRVVLLPTDTVYGLAVSVDAYPGGPEPLFVIKHRDPHKTIAWLIDSIDMFNSYGKEIPPYAYRLAEQFWPGGLTLVVKASDAVPPAYRRQDGTIGLRIPAFGPTQQIIGNLGCALATTSANLSGYPTPATYQEIDDIIKSQIDMALVAPCPCSTLASTIVVCTGPEPVIVREGTIPSRQIMSL